MEQAALAQEDKKIANMVTAQAQRDLENATGLWVVQDSDTVVEAGRVPAVEI